MSGRTYNCTRNRNLIQLDRIIMNCHFSTNQFYTLLQTSFFLSKWTFGKKNLSKSLRLKKTVSILVIIQSSSKIGTYLVSSTICFQVKLHQRLSTLVKRLNRHIKFRQQFMSRIYNGCKVTTSYINGFQR